MRAFEFITESRSADLYHGTSLENAEQILDSDTLYPGDAGHGDEGNVSLTRDFGVVKNFAEWADPAGVIFVLDQQRIMHNTRLRPFDYGGGYDEMEEVSNKPIPNISRAIKQIIVLKHREFDPDDFPTVLSDPRTVIKNQASVPKTVRQFNKPTTQDGDASQTTGSTDV